MSGKDNSPGKVRPFLRCWELRSPEAPPDPTRRGGSWGGRGAQCYWLRARGRTEGMSFSKNLEFDGEGERTEA